MRKFVKTISIFVAVLAMAVMAAAAYGDWRLPDTITTCGDTVRLDYVYSVDTQGLHIDTDESNAVLAPPA